MHEPEPEPPEDYDWLLDVADAALDLVAIAGQLEDATGTRLNELTYARDWAWHELLVAARAPCGCDDGTCPSRPALPYEDVQVAGGLL